MKLTKKDFMTQQHMALRENQTMMTEEPNKLASQWGDRQIIYKKDRGRLWWYTNIESPQNDIFIYQQGPWLSELPSWSVE